MAKTLSSYLLITLILTLGLGQLLRFEFMSVPLYAHDLLVVIILTLNLKHIIKLKVPNSLRIFLFGLALGWIYALTTYSVFALLLPLLYSLRLLSYLTLYLLIKEQKYQLPNAAFSLSAFTTVLIGLSQYLLLPDMRWAQYLGWDDHLHRLILPHYDPTFTAVMLTLAVLRLSKINSTNLVLIITSSLAILLTYTRSVWLSLALTGMLFIKSKLLFLLTLCGMFLAIFFLPQKFGEGNNLLRTYSISSRLKSDISIVTRSGWSLLTGRGLNTLPLLTPPYSLYPNHATGPNNSYLYLLATTGIFGLVGWLIFLRSLYLHSTSRPMLFFFLIASLFNNVMFYPFALLWVLLTESNPKNL